MVYLDDGEMVGADAATATASATSTTTQIDKPVNQIEWDLATIERGGFEHFMLKEIFEQPETRARTRCAGHLLEDEGTARARRPQHDATTSCMQIDRIIITACGTSWHAALIGEYMLEELARIPVEVEYASEFRYRNPIVDERTLVHRHLASRARRPTRWRRCARRSAAGRGRSAW